MALFRFIWRYLLLGHSRIVEERLRNLLFARLQDLSPAFYQRTRTGDIMARAVNDLNAVRMAAGMGLVAMTDALVLGTAAIGFMFHLSARLTLLALIPMPFIVVLSRLLTRRMASGFERVQGAFSTLTERVREAFAGIRVVKTCAREDWTLERMREEGERYAEENIRLARTMALFFPLMTVFTNLGLCAVVWFGGRLAILDRISTGDFVAFTAYLNLLTWPLMAMGWVINLVQRGSTSMRRIHLILSETPDIVTPADPVPLPARSGGGIRFQDLTLRYPGQSRDALRHVSLSAAEGKTAALVGRVGCGKTTLLLCIPRLLAFPEGRVFLDDTDVTRCDLKALRSAVGFVTQETILFSDTLRNNLLLGRTDIPDHDLIAALKTTRLYEELQEMDRGLDTLLGERGLSLSGGQRQRLAMARALLPNPPVLILDDALSMVDTRTEAEILERILTRRKGRTTIFVSHRLATIRRADRIFVLQDGQLTEEGDHASLMALGGEYAGLYTRQRLERQLDQDAP
jgi:ATP-binding cassette subfamily B protein